MLLEGSLAKLKGRCRWMHGDFAKKKEKDKTHLSTILTTYCFLRLKLRGDHREIEDTEEAGVVRFHLNVLSTQILVSVAGILAAHCESHMTGRERNCFSFPPSAHPLTVSHSDQTTPRVKST